MFKTISAALLAVSVLAAPALAASADKTNTAAKVTKQAPVTTSDQSTDKTSDKTAIKPGVANANAKVSGEHVTHHKVHRSHKTMGATKTKTHAKVSLKQTKPVSKRG